jgi:hypothetical protein
MVLTVFSALSPVNGFLVTVPAVMRQQHRPVDAGVVMSGPHGFAVRTGALRLARRRVHRIPYRTSVTIAIRLSNWG